MKERNEKETQQLCCEIGKQAVDEAISIYRQTRKLSPDFCVCRCSMNRAMHCLKNHFETGEPLHFIRISFKDLMETTHIYVNIQHIKNNF